MFGGNTPWGNNNNMVNPFQNQNLDQLQNQYQQQLDTLNRIRSAQTDVLNEINKELSTLDKDELSMLYESGEYIMSKNVYESAFLQFISNKFSAEFVGSPEGKEAAMNLLKVIKSSKDKIAYQTKVKNDKINRVLDLLENDPEMRRRYDELTTGNINKPKETLSTGTTKKTK